MNQIKKNKIYFFTKYSQKGPSSRYRSYQYKSILNKSFCIKYYPLFDDNYIINLYEKNKINYFKVFFAYFFRIKS